jgi:hypothetical protein
MAHVARRDDLLDPLGDGVLRHGYSLDGFFDEAFEAGAGGVTAGPHYAELIGQIAAMDGQDVKRAADLANRSFLHRGVTFTVYSDGDRGTERILPFDPRIRALNHLSDDLPLPPPRSQTRTDDNKPSQQPHQQQQQFRRPASDSR